MLNDFMVEPLKRRLPSDVTFVIVLRHMCWTFSVRYNMYFYINCKKAKYYRQDKTEEKGNGS